MAGLQAGIRRRDRGRMDGCRDDAAHEAGRVTQAGSSVGDAGLAHAALRGALDALRGDRRAEAWAALAPLLPPHTGGDIAADPAPLLGMAQESNARLDWIGGLLAYEVLVAAGHARFAKQQDWMARRAALQHDFHAQFEARSSFGRLAEVLGMRLRRPVTAIATTRLRPGLVAMAVYRHAVTLEGEAAPAVLVEKVFGDRRTDAVKVAQKDLLFGAMPAARLRAPRYHGLHREGRFTSVLLDMAEGDPLPLERWDPVVRELLYHFWCEAPPTSLARGLTLARPMLETLRAIAGGREAATLHAALGGMDAAALLAGSLPALERLVAAMPVFVLHDDLHAGNILVDAEGVPRLIDWDRWWLAPIGAGWPLLEEDAPPMLPSRITWARPLPFGVDTRELMTVAAMAALYRSMRGGRIAQAAQHLKRVLAWEG